MRLAAVLITLCIAGFAPQASGHPEDEFCVPGQDGLDPALCRALAELDSSDPASGSIDLEPLLDDSGEVRGIGSTLRLYVTIGVRHILPGGLDHILFVLALFLSSARIRSLVIQISTFTVAHTATLALAASGVIAPSAQLVEPLIAATIAFVAIENLVFDDMTRWRPVLVFLFGLIHGLGFAGFFGELGLPEDQFWSALIGFNLGVEIGQLAVVIAAFLLVRGVQRNIDATVWDHAYRRYAVVPASALIGATGLWWAIERVTANPA